MKQAPQKSVHRKTWCGPYALAVWANQDYDVIYQLCRKALRQRVVTGMWNHEVERVTRRLDFLLIWKNQKAYSGSDKEPTVAKLRDILPPGRQFLVQITRHYISIDTSDWMACDNHHAKWIPLDEWEHRRAKVCKIAEVRKRGKKKNPLPSLSN